MGENLYLTENWLSRKEMWYAVDNHNCMCQIIYVKWFSIQILDKRLLTKISIFHEIAQNFTYSQKS